MDLLYWLKSINNAYEFSIKYNLKSLPKVSMYSLSKIYCDLIISGILVDETYLLIMYK